MSEHVHSLKHRRRWTAGPVRDRLRHHRAELVAMRRAGASYLSIAAWLRTEHRIRTTHTTVMRYLGSLPEMQTGHSAGAGAAAIAAAPAPAEGAHHG